MANYVGKTKEFAEEIINYYINKSSMPDPEQLYVGLLSGIPTPGNAEPYDASAVRAKEVSAGAFRVALPAAVNFTTEKSVALSAVTATNNLGVVIDFPTLPGESTDLVEVSGYALIRGSSNQDTSAYVGYEVFAAPGNLNKQRLGRGGDTIRINAQGFTILEK